MKSVKGKFLKKLKSIKPVDYLKPERVLQVFAIDGFVDSCPKTPNSNEQQPKFFRKDSTEHEKIKQSCLQVEEQPEIIDVAELMKDLEDDDEEEDEMDCDDEIDDKENIRPTRKANIDLVVDKENVNFGMKFETGDRRQSNPLKEINVSSPFRKPDLNSCTLFDPNLLAAFEQAVKEHIKMSEEERQARIEQENIEKKNREETEEEKEETLENIENEPPLKTRRIEEDDAGDGDGDLLSQFEEKCLPGGDGSVIFYTTTLKGIRKTFEDCNKVRFLLESFGVIFYERDISMHTEYKEEMWKVLEGKVNPPRLFIKGRYIGGAEEVLTLHEQGKLKLLLKDIPVDRSNSPCEGCAGVRFILCFKCNGSHRIISDNGLSSECLQCNENGSPFFFSETNKFIAAGCNNKAFMTGIEPNIVGCESACVGDTLFGPNNTCTGYTCCETVIPSRLQVFNAKFETESEFKGCKLAFIAEEEWFDDNMLTEASALQNMNYVPALLDWAIPGGDILPNPTPREYFCFQYENLPSNSTRCFCQIGFEGTPYLPNGCQDIDECQDPYNRCGDATCVNLPGYYQCENRKTWILILGIGLGFGVLCLAIGAWFLYRYLKKRRNIKLKKKHFKRNGGLLLQQQMCSSEGNIEKTKVFTSKELIKATDNFNKDRVLGQGGQGTVYKGMLVDGRIIAVKKSKLVDAGRVEEFINEVVILSQVNHRNVVKLLGCCLETEVPLLVYEFIPNGTLFQYLHHQTEEFPLSWDTRLRIAKEVAEALSYLHSAASIPIYHRDIKSSNILLDEKYRAKVSDFGTSRSISIDQTHLTTRVQGTFGYLDPEYFQSSQFTEKSDVYSFGVVLVELITGEKPISSERAEEGRSLATYFIISMDESHLFEIVDPRVAKEAKHEELIMVAKLAYRCLSLSGKKRPTMKEIAMELERISSLQKDSSVQHNQEKMNDCVHVDTTYPLDATSTSTCSIFDSEIELIETDPLIYAKTK
ncbi:hypothetical protein COLO4_26792 [Corchorus olitorius]|uniref:Protein kinase domain-containing protein n=1 Tax=Corchorus olitorius TaxID=93759 RepID=A0A1R3HUC7_9ROSI|nr:hypothetical protein COLO4_26792 [Corchorus olitorius]